MTELKRYEQLKDAYVNTTAEHNIFKQLLLSLNWDHYLYTPQEEHVFMWKGLAIVVENLDPLQEKRKPYVSFLDGSKIVLGDKK